jgi:F-type H+-transporting ATPase subunit epsilon
MAQATMRIDIVSAEHEIFSGAAEVISVTGEMGELGIHPGHTPLFTSLKPGNVRITLPGQKEELFYVSSGMLEVQPYMVTVLADTALRAADIDEAAALLAKEEAERHIASKTTEIDFAKATAELAEAIAQLRTVQALKKRGK